MSVAENSYTYCSLTKATGCPIKTRVVGRDLLVETSGFSYYDYDGKPMAASTLTGDGLRRVSSIDVKVVVSIKPGNPNYRHTSLTRVRLPNVEINLVGTT